MKKKITITIICAVLSCVCLIGTTFAWLVDKTDPVKNTFTVGNVDITLTETKGTEVTAGKEYEFKMVPGNDIAKDPKVTVVAGSEACYVFVKIEKSANFDTFMEYALADGWVQLKDNSNVDVTGVFYRTVDATTAESGAKYNVLNGDKVTVKNTVTKGDMDGLDDASKYPTLTFTAYAVQSDNVADAYTAWTHAIA